MHTKSWNRKTNEKLNSLSPVSSICVEMGWRDRRCSMENVSNVFYVGVKREKQCQHIKGLHVIVLREIERSCQFGPVRGTIDFQCRPATLALTSFPPEATILASGSSTYDHLAILSLDLELLDSDDYEVAEPIRELPTTFLRGYRPFQFLATFSSRFPGKIVMRINCDWKEPEFSL